MRVFPGISNFLRLIKRCFVDIGAFAVFFLTWVVLFGVMYEILGGDVSNAKDYETVPVTVQFLLNSFRNSIGDVHAPGYKFWVENYDSGPTTAQVMIYQIWVLWIFN